MFDLFDTNLFRRLLIDKNFFCITNTTLTLQCDDFTTQTTENLKGSPKCLSIKSNILFLYALSGTHLQTS
jgi:hypothetical protein